MAKDKGKLPVDCVNGGYHPDIPTPAAVAPPVAPPKVLSMEEMIDEKEAALLAMQEQLNAQLNGVANQLFLIKQLKHPEEFEAPGQDSGEPAGEAPNSAPDGHM